ncbi:MAG: glucan biosynthesis protein G [Pseudomonadota bacterium]
MANNELTATPVLRLAQASQTPAKPQPQAVAPTALERAAVDADTADGVPFSFEILKSKAQALSLKPFGPSEPIRADWLPGGYDSYRHVWMPQERALWRGTGARYALHTMPVGWLFKRPVTVASVTDGVATPLSFDASDFIDQREGRPALPTYGVPVSGFKVTGPLNAPSKMDEIVVFQGASYFRALARGQVYGLSARGLALRTASPRGEEFPEFRRFWIETPAPGETRIRMYALLDSASVAGAYAFTVDPGDATEVDVDAVLYPRRALTEVGIAPLTSMLMLGPLNPTRVSDFRPRVHDNDGLAIQTGTGERIWRPLTNPHALQISAFVDSNPKGFGLVQRARDFRAYEDLEARYDLRPSAWITPRKPFGDGSVLLVEIPTEDEIHDNIVAVWRPREPVPEFQPYEMSYRISWRDHAPTRSAGPYVAQSRAGRIKGSDVPRYRFVLDYVDTTPFSGPALPDAVASVSGGAVSGVAVRRNDQTGGLRATFTYTPEGRERADIRINLGSWNGRRPETWIYRWVAEQ